MTGEGFQLLTEATRVFLSSLSSPIPLFLLSFLSSYLLSFLLVVFPLLSPKV